MKNSSLLFIFLVIYISYLFTACQATKTAQTDNDTDIFSEEYYVKNAKNNLERLQLLLSGLYVQKNEDTKKKILETWTVRGGEDSILAYTLPVGEPAKDGHWLYLHQFISNAPDEPVYSAFQQFKQISRDSIESIIYDNPQPVTLEDLITQQAACFKNLDFSTLEENGEHVIYVKTGTASFEGYSKLYKNPRADANNYRKDKYTIEPEKFKFRSSFYLDEEGNNFLMKNHIIAHLMRLDPAKHSLFSKRKKK